MPDGVIVAQVGTRAYTIYGLYPIFPTNHPELSELQEIPEEARITSSMRAKGSWSRSQAEEQAVGFRAKGLGFKGLGLPV